MRQTSEVSRNLEIKRHSIDIERFGNVPATNSIGKYRLHPNFQANTRLSQANIIFNRLLTTLKLIEMRNSSTSTRMTNSTCFANGSALPQRRKSREPSSCPLRCVAEKPNVAISTPKSRDSTKKRPPYRVLEPGENVPEPPVHRSIPLGGYLIEPMFGLGTPSSRAAKYGGIYKSNFFVLKDQVFVNDYDAIVACTRDTSLFMARDTFEPSENLFGSDALFMLDGEDHSRMRGALAPAFSQAVFPLYMAGIQRCVRRLWSRAEETVARRGSVLLDPMFRSHYLAITIEITTGLGDASEVAAQLRDRINTAQTMMYGPPFGPLFDRAVRARDEILQILEDVIRRALIEHARTIQRLRAYGDRIAALSARDIAAGEVNVLLVLLASSDLSTEPGAANDGETIARLARLLVVLWFAGYMTSAATTSCATFELGLSSSIRDALYEEQASLDQHELTYGQVQSQMPLLDAYLTEVLRLHPPISGIHRKPTRDVAILGRRVPAGTTIYFELEPSMRDSRLYPNPEQLQIDRFLKRPGVPTPPRILSFGSPGDVHHCLGSAMSRVMMKATLAVLLREYEMVLDEKQSTRYSYIPEDSPSSKVRVRKLRKR